MRFYKVFCILAITGVIWAQQVSAQAEDEAVFPDWVRQTVEFWISGKVSDSELLSMIEDILNRGVVPGEPEPGHHTARSALGQDELIESNGVPSWFRDRAVWWTEGRISNTAFLESVHYLTELGYIRYDPMDDTFAYKDADSGLLRFLPSEDDLQRITGTTKWIFVSTESGDADAGPVRIVLKDIARVYEPIFYKFKVPSMVMQISDQDTLDGQNILGTNMTGGSAYLYGKPNEASECTFAHTAEGAVTRCTYESLVIEVVIYDPYNEHFQYDSPNMVLDETEPTSRFLGEILRIVAHYKKVDLEHRLHTILQAKTDAATQVDVPSQPPNAGIAEPAVLEMSKRHGISGLACTRDDFGMATIAGRYINDGVPKDTAEVTVSFYDKNGNRLGHDLITLHDLGEFEEKGFVGHTREAFHSCLANWK